MYKNLPSSIPCLVISDSNLVKVLENEAKGFIPAPGVIIEKEGVSSPVNTF